MPDKDDKSLTDEEDLPKTSLHAHADGREDDIEGTSDPEVGEDGDHEGAEEGPPGNPVSDQADSKDE